MHDLVLSCGYLAFARQAGFLRGVEEAGLAVDGICGTSSGALAGALWAAGRSADQIAEIFSGRLPIARVRPHLAPWRGAFSLRGVISELRQWLPSRIEDLERPFGVGVMDARRVPFLVTSGSLAEAVAASCAIPRLFAPVVVDGVPWLDGGIADRTFLDPWRQRRPDRPVLLHLVDPSRGQALAPSAPGVTVVRSAKSGASFLGLGDFRGQFEEARRAARDVLTAAGTGAARARA